MNPWDEYSDTPAQDEQGPWSEFQTKPEVLTEQAPADKMPWEEYQSPPASAPSPVASLSAPTAAPGVLNFQDATDPASVAFKQKLQADAMAKAEKDGSEGALKTFGREFITHIAPATAGALSSLGGAAVGAAGGPVGIVAGDVAAGIAGEAAGTALQRKMYSPEELATMDAQEAINAKEHGFASQMGSLLGEVPMMLTGAFFAKKLAMAGLKGAGEAVTKEAVKEATGKLGSKLTTSATTFGTMGGAGAASEMVKQSEATPEDQRLGYGAIAGETIKGGIGGLALGGASEVLGKFIPAATTYLGGIGIRAPTDALVLTVANSLYDTVVHGKAFEPYEVLKGTAAETPAFMIMNAIMGGHAMAGRRVEGRPEVKPPVAPEAEVLPVAGKPVRGVPNPEPVTGETSTIVDKPITPPPVDQSTPILNKEDGTTVKAGEPLTPVEQAGISKAADFMQGVDADKATLETPVRQKYVEPSTPVKSMSVKALREELKAQGIETTTRQKVVELRDIANRNRTEKLAQEKRMQRMEAPPKPIKVESAEAMGNRQRGVVDRVGGTSEAAAIARADAMEQKIREHIDSGKYLEPGTTVVDRDGTLLEVRNVRRAVKDRDMGSLDLTYELRNPDNPDDVIVRKTSQLSTADAQAEEVPFRTGDAIAKADPREANRARFLVTRVLGKNAPVEIVDRIFERGAERLGKYEKGLVTIAAKGDMDRTAYHEAYHGAKDMLMTAKDRADMDRILPGEEAQADSFMEYAAKNGEGFGGKIRQYFDRLNYRIRKLFGAARGIDELKAMYARLLGGKMAGRQKAIPSSAPEYRTLLKPDTADPDLVAGIDRQNKMFDDLKAAQAPNRSLMRRVRDLVGVHVINQQAPIDTRALELGRKIERDAGVSPRAEGNMGERFIIAEKSVKHMAAQAAKRFTDFSDKIKSMGLKSEQDLAEFGAYMNAKRTVELGDVRDGEAFDSPLTIPQAEKIVEMYETRHAKKAAFKAASLEAQKEFRKSLDPLLEAGTISQKSYDSVKDKFYMPRWFIDKIDPVVGQQAGKLGEVSVRQSGIRYLKSGSKESMVLDPLTLMAHNIISAESIASRNKSMRRLADLADVATDTQKKLTDFDIKALPLQETPRDGYERVDYWVDGEKKSMEVRRDLAEALTYSQGIDPTTAAILRIGSGTSFVKFMATAGNWEFSLGNVPRDWGLQYLAGDSWSSFVPKAFAQQLKQAGRILLDGKLKKLLRDGYYKYGGETGWLSSSALLNTASMDPKLRAGKTAVQKAVWALSVVGNKSEELSRLMNVNQEFKKMGVSAKTATPDQWAMAVHKARSILDFSENGKTVKFLDNMIPFLNPTFQGGRSVIRAFKERPIQTNLKAAQLVAGATALYYMARKNNPETIESISEGDMMSKLNIPLGITSDKDGEKQYGYVGIPIDQGWRPFIVLGKLLADKAHGLDVDPSILRRTFFANYVPADINNMPPILAAMQAYFNNYDFWKGDKIWRGRKVDPEMEQTARTPDRYVKVGEALGMSPERLRVAESKILPNNPLTWARDKAFDMFSPDARKDLNKDTWQSLADYPGTRKYIRMTSPRSLNNDDLKAAKRLKIPAKGKAAASVLNEIEKREQIINTQRQKNDVALQKIAAQVKSGAMQKADIYKAAWQLVDEKGKRGKERGRALRALKQRYPDLRIIAPSEN